MGDDDTVRQRLEGGVLTLTLARPEKKNALTAAMYRALSAAFAEADAGSGVGAIVLEGSADAFCAGNDIADFARAPAEAGAAAIAFLHALVRLETPIVAAVEGVAVGIGTTLLLHCDAVLAAPSARFRTPFIDLALCPEGGSSLLMPARLGRAASTRLLMLGDSLSAEEAAACGLVDAVVADARAEAAALAARLAAKPRGAMRATKRLLRAADEGRVAGAIDREAAAFAQRLGSPEAQAAFAAFLTKR